MTVHLIKCNENIHTLAMEGFQFHSSISLEVSVLLPSFKILGF